MGLVYNLLRDADNVEIDGRVDVYVVNYIPPQPQENHTRHLWLDLELQALCLHAAGQVGQLACSQPHMDLRMHATTDTSAVTCQACLELIHS